MSDDQLIAVSRRFYDRRERIGDAYCADFACHGDGVASFEQVLANRYFGARLLGALFLSWFHWPI